MCEQARCPSSDATNFAEPQGGRDCAQNRPKLFQRTSTRAIAASACAPAAASPRLQLPHHTDLEPSPVSPLIKLGWSPGRPLPPQCTQCIAPGWLQDNKNKCGDRRRAEELSGDLAELSVSTPTGCNRPAHVQVFCARGADGHPKPIIRQ
jgi:hypothetical protein